MDRRVEHENRKIKNDQYKEQIRIYKNIFDTCEP
jgi:hypothetical protein